MALEFLAFFILWMMVAISLLYASLMPREGKKLLQRELPLEGSSSRQQLCGFKNRGWHSAMKATTPVQALQALAAGTKL